MADQKKAVLKDEELEKVAGGGIRGRAPQRCHEGPYDMGGASASWEGTEVTVPSNYKGARDGSGGATVSWDKPDDKIANKYKGARNGSGGASESW